MNIVINTIDDKRFGTKREFQIKTEIVSQPFSAPSDVARIVPSRTNI